MNRKEAAELLPIIKAFSEGKEIEGLYKGIKSPWFKIKDMHFNEVIIFRIKPEPKYRPFENAKECWAEMLKHQPFGWLIPTNCEVYSLIVFVDNEGIVIGDRNNGVIGFVTATDLFKIKFADGTPFGVKVEE